MKKYAPILCILSIAYVLLANCTKATVAQITFSVSLASDTTQIQGYVIPASSGNPARSVRAKYLPLLIKINATEKAVTLYPKAYLYLKYIMYDTLGKEMTNGYLYEKLSSNNNAVFFNQFFGKLAPNESQLIHQNLTSQIANKTTYNIVRIESDTLSKSPYKIVFTLVVKDSAKNDESLPTISPKEAQRTLKVIINPNNPDKASYILTYNKNRFYPKSRIYQEKLGVCCTTKKDYNLCDNDYLNIIG